MPGQFSRVLFLFAAFAITPLALAQSNHPTTQVNLSSGARSSASKASAALPDKKKPDGSVAADAATTSTTEKISAEKATAVGDPLLRVLVTKGVLTADEARAIVNVGNPGEQRDRRAALLRDKGLLSEAEFEALRAETPAAGSNSSSGGANRAAAVAEKAMPAKADQAAKPQNPSAAPSVIAAIVPVRLLPIDPPNAKTNA
jgi:hypothetical protein